MNEQRNHDSSNDKSREKKMKTQRVCLLQLRLLAKQFSSAARRHRLSFGRRLISVHVLYAAAFHYHASQSITTAAASLLIFLHANKNVLQSVPLFAYALQLLMN